ncbi:hypothetical protein [Nonomuraea rhizosphaerae]|uniref:hypothetical protein n=1 Tax=Nonomuraea rhizosphaerae TaxID=2665663 RepID=UPI001C5DE495|nr:hypothetical protein [Nonomuraea rhizosphaerae]
MSPSNAAIERGHGRINRWTTWAATVDDSLGLPYAARLAVIRRDVADLAGSPRSKEVVMMITSRAHLSAAEISAHTRAHWGIENLEHRSRDTVWLEDDQQAYLGHGPRVLATLRNLALGLFSIHGISKIKETVQAIGRNPLRALPLMTQSHTEPSATRL